MTLTKVLHFSTSKINNPNFVILNISEKCLWWIRMELRQKQKAVLSTSVFERTTRSQFWKPGSNKRNEGTQLNLLLVY